MRITVGELKRLVHEAASPKEQAKALVSHAVDVAEEYVNGVVAGSHDRQSAAELKQAAEQLASYAKFLLNRREPNAEPVAMVAYYASKLDQETGFWKRPTFINKQQHVDRVQDLLKQMQRAQHKALV